MMFIMEEKIISDGVIPEEVVKTSVHLRRNGWI